ncbi:MAG TPA: hypothetical protein VFS02_18060 [Telluria sp.]|nr:hypothetical protein [Telluria sp.]
MAERDAADIDLRRVRRGAIAIAGGILFAALVSWLVLRALGPATNSSALALAPFSPAPRLQPAPQPDRAAYFAEKARKTGSYGWIDRDAGIAHIPLDEAIRLLAARGGATAPAAPRSAK